MLDVDICDISTEQQHVIKAANVFSVQPHVSNFVQLFNTTEYIHQSPVTSVRSESTQNTYRHVEPRHKCIHTVSGQKW